MVDEYFLTAQFDKTYRLTKSTIEMQREQNTLASSLAPSFVPNNRLFLTLRLNILLLNPITFAPHGLNILWVLWVILDL
jgi:hypothetical protein